MSESNPEFRYPRRRIVRTLLRPVIDAAFLILSDLVIEGREEVVPEALRKSAQLKVWTSAVTAENVTAAFSETADGILRREA